MTESEYIQVFDAYRMYIFYFCNKLIHHREDAEDITLFVFIKLWEYREKVLPESAKSFLLVTANHKCQDYFKMKKRYPEVLGRMSLYDLDNLEIENEVLQYLYGIINTLSPHERRIMLLKYKEGKEVKEISKITGLRSQTVSNAIYIALSKLKAIIKKTAKNSGPHN